MPVHMHKHMSAHRHTHIVNTVFVAQPHTRKVKQINRHTRTHTHTHTHNAIQQRERKTQLEEKNVRSTSQRADFSSGPPSLAVLGMGINRAGK